MTNSTPSTATTTNPTTPLTGVTSHTETLAPMTTSKEALQRLRFAATLASVSLIAAGAVIGGAGPASADSGIYTIGNVNLRTGPGTGYDIVDVVPSGSSPSYLCWERGEVVDGVDVWMRVDYNGTVGSISSALDDSSYYTDEDITPKYGIPACSDYDSANSGSIDSGSGSGLVTDGSYDSFDREAAASWAYDSATDQQPFGAACTWFVSNALWAGGLPQTPTWTAEGDHGTLQPRPGTASATAVGPFLDNFVATYPFSTLTDLDFTANTVPDAEVGDVIAYDWEGDGSYDHLSLITSIQDDDYPNVSEWGTQVNWWEVTIGYQDRGWTWSANSDTWLQNSYPDVRAQLLHIDTTHVSTY